MKFQMNPRKTPINHEKKRLETWQELLENIIIFTQRFINFPSDFGSIFIPFSFHLTSILAPFWGHFGSILRLWGGPGEEARKDPEIRRFWGPVGSPRIYFSLKTDTFPMKKLIFFIDF